MWTEQLLAEDPAKPIPNKYRGRYRKDEIKSVLVQETGGKCAYCEAFVLAVASGDIEHVACMSLNRHLAYEWQNLLLCCPECNQKKSDYNGDHGDLLNPVVDDPTLHIVFAGPGPYTKNDSLRGRLTITELALGRAGLLIARHERLQAIEELIVRFEDEQELEKKQIWHQLIEKEMGATKSFSYAVRCYVETRLITS